MSMETISLFSLIHRLPSLN
ncbi:hypothetical protein ACHAXN_000793 [Cyclotella atomus]